MNTPRVDRMMREVQISPQPDWIASVFEWLDRDGQAGHALVWVALIAVGVVALFAMMA